jgi:hypothetical protein
MQLVGRLVGVSLVVKFPKPMNFLPVHVLHEMCLWVTTGTQCMLHVCAHSLCTLCRVHSFSFYRMSGVCIEGRGNSEANPGLNQLSTCR